MVMEGCGTVLICLQEKSMTITINTTMVSIDLFILNVKKSECVFLKESKITSCIIINFMIKEWEQNLHLL